LFQEGGLEKIRLRQSFKINKKSSLQGDDFLFILK
jgi:hypothetical protein